MPMAESRAIDDPRCALVGNERYRAFRKPCDGAETCCRVIVISDQIAAATRHRVGAVRALAVVEKPYQVEEVLDLLRLAMDQR